MNIQGSNWIITNYSIRKYCITQKNFMIFVTFCKFFIHPFSNNLSKFSLECRLKNLLYLPKSVLFVLCEFSRVHYMQYDRADQKGLQTTGLCFLYSPVSWVEFTIVIPDTCPSSNICFKSAIELLSAFRISSACSWSTQKTIVFANLSVFVKKSARCFATASVRAFSERILSNSLVL